MAEDRQNAVDLQVPSQDVAILMVKEHIELEAETIEVTKDATGPGYNFKANGIPG